MIRCLYGDVSELGLSSEYAYSLNHTIINHYYAFLYNAPLHKISMLIKRIVAKRPLHSCHLYLARTTHCRQSCIGLRP